MKPPELFTWFIDRSLGRKIAVELRGAGFRVEEHASHFADDAPDAEWLGEAGRRGWVVLTKDKAVRRNALELAAIVAGNVACFSLGHGNLKAAQMAQFHRSPLSDGEGSAALRSSDDGFHYIDRERDRPDDKRHALAAAEEHQVSEPHVMKTRQSSQGAERIQNRP